MRSMIFVLAVLSFLPAARSATLHVPSGSYPTIQSAIDAASFGDTVLVGPGTYVENIDFLAKEIEVISENGPEVTMIDGSQPANPNAASVVTITGGNGLLEGFKLAYGTGTYDALFFGHIGGGVLIEYASPTIRNNILYVNSTTFGGGVFCYYSDAVIVDNTFMFNSASYNGGGMAMFYSSPEITGNEFAYSSASRGPGIHCSTYCYPSIKGNIFRENSGTYGGAIDLLFYCDAVIENNAIFSNSVVFYGGGIHAHINCNPVITNNTLTGNHAKVGGGALSLEDHCDGTVRNAVCWANGSDYGEEFDIFDFSNVTIDYSDVCGGQSSVIMDPTSTLVWGDGIIDADPRLDPTDHHHLTWISPCINRGTDDGVPPKDIDGYPRPYMGTTDMGCDEFIGVHPLEGHTSSIPHGTGGKVYFTLSGEPGNAGRDYVMLGSLSWNAPGIPLPGGQATMAVNWDLFTKLVLHLLNTPAFANFSGTLDASGNAMATFDTLGPLPPEAAGLTLSFAYALYAPWDFASNPMNIEIY